jgi:hypothetical protein
MVGLPSKSGGVWSVRSEDVLKIDCSSCRDCLEEGGPAGFVPVSPLLFAPNQLVERERKGCVGNATRSTTYLRALL